MACGIFDEWQKGAAFVGRRFARFRTEMHRSKADLACRTLPTNRELIATARDRAFGARDTSASKIRRRRVGALPLQGRRSHMDPDQ